MLVHGFEWTLAEVAHFWGISFSTVKEHVDKGMARLRGELGVEQ
jgi:DNA-directed RNA polymerase specialized sigma24 family protein